MHIVKWLKRLFKKEKKSVVVMNVTIPIARFQNKRKCAGCHSDISSSQTSTLDENNLYYIRCKSCTCINKVSHGVISLVEDPIDFRNSLRCFR